MLDFPILFKTYAYFNKKKLLRVAEVSPFCVIYLYNHNEVRYGKRE